MLRSAPFPRSMMGIGRKEAGILLKADECYHGWAKFWWEGIPIDAHGWRSDHQCTIRETRDGLGSDHRQVSTPSWCTRRTNQSLAQGWCSFHPKSSELGKGMWSWDRKTTRTSSSHEYCCRNLVRSPLHSFCIKLASVCHSTWRGIGSSDPQQWPGLAQHVLLSSSPWRVAIQKSLITHSVNTIVSRCRIISAHTDIVNHASPVHGAAIILAACAGHPACIFRY